MIVIILLLFTLFFLFTRIGGSLFLGVASLLLSFLAAFLTNGFVYLVIAFVLQVMWNSKEGR